MNKLFEIVFKSSTLLSEIKIYGLFLSIKIHKKSIHTTTNAILQRVIKGLLIAIKYKTINTEKNINNRSIRLIEVIGNYH